MQYLIIFSLSNVGAIALANEIRSVIQFDEETHTPYYYYNTSGVEHFVWFKDARTVDAILDLVEEYQLKGVAVWNILYYFSQTWLAINSHFKVETVDTNT